MKTAVFDKHVVITGNEYTSKGKTTLTGKFCFHSFDLNHMKMAYTTVETFNIQKNHMTMTHVIVETDIILKKDIW